jgi:hypothetical protein
MLISILPLLQLGCAFEENLPHKDLTGTVRIPIDSITITLGQEEDAREVTDMRVLGPVYIGAYPSVVEGLYPYAHPEMGPILSEGQDGNTYPYGGSSVGRFDWACYQPLICKTVTGRFKDYDDIIDFFANVLDDPIRTQDGHLVTSSSEYQDRCFEVLNTLGDWEHSFITPAELDFEEDGDYLVADVELPHIYYREGMKVWGWIDMPSTTFDFNTCDPGIGDQLNFYDEFYPMGTNVFDLLNYPGKYIDFGDWVSQEGATVNDSEKEFELELGYKYAEE